MTVNYSLQVSNNNLGTFFSLFRRWRGSVAKALYQELILYFLLYGLLSYAYRVHLDGDQRIVFENVVLYCRDCLAYIPITFVLGFFMSVVYTRWANIQASIAWPDKVALSLITFMGGNDGHSRVYRISIVRYLLAAEVLVLRDISVPVKKRFPTLQHLVTCGLLTGDELEEYENLHCDHAKYWLPIQWALGIIRTAHKEKLVDNFYIVFGHILDFRGKLGQLLDYDWVSIPLVYTQVVTLSVWTYFGTCLLARQFLDPRKGFTGYSLDIYFPVSTFLQFVFYMGWLKVAECMINPLGEDDDDFELNYIIDRNVQVAFEQVDEMCGRIPRLKSNQEKKIDISHVPYTQESAGQKNDPLVPSCSKIK